jgi:hypothetical protein
VVDATQAEPIVREIHIAATAETVFEFFTDPRKLTRWLAVDATLDPRPGGACHQTHDAGTDQEPLLFHMRGPPDAGLAGPRPAARGPRRVVARQRLPGPRTRLAA